MLALRPAGRCADLSEPCRRNPSVGSRKGPRDFRQRGQRAPKFGARGRANAIFCFAECQSDDGAPLSCAAQRLSQFLEHDPLMGSTNFNVTLGGKLTTRRQIPTLHLHLRVQFSGGRVHIPRIDFNHRFVSVSPVLIFGRPAPLNKGARHHRFATRGGFLATGASESPHFFERPTSRIVRPCHPAPHQRLITPNAASFVRMTTLSTIRRAMRSNDTGVDQSGSHVGSLVLRQENRIRGTWRA